MNLRHFGSGSSDAAARSGLDLRISAGVIRMPVRVPDLGDAPPLLRRCFKHRAGARGIAYGCFITRRFMRYTTLIFAEDGKERDVPTHANPPDMYMETRGQTDQRW